MPLSVLLVEDEDHKISDLIQRLHTGKVSVDVVVKKSVREAVVEVYERSFDLIILDMALPTFEKGHDGETGGLPQSAGGIEVLRALNETEARSTIIVVTQFPDVLISGQQIVLPDLSKELEVRYNQHVAGVILYSYNSKEWEREFDRALETIL